MARRPPQPSPQHKWVITKIVWDKHGNVLEEHGYWYDGSWDKLGGGPMNTQAANAWRFYDDSGGEAASAALAAQDTTATASVATSTAIQLRFRVDETGGADGSDMDDYTLQYSKNGGTFTNVPTSDSGDGIQAATAGLTSEADTTNRASDPISDPGGGSFVTGGQSTDGTVNDRLITANNFTEHVWGLQFNASNLSDGDEFGFELTGSGIDSSVRAHLEIFIASTEKNVTGLLGEKNLVGFAPTVELWNEYKPQLGTMNLESSHDSLPVTYVYTINPTRGEVNFEGFAATVTTEGGVGEKNITGLLGELNLEGFAAALSITREAFPQFGTIELEGFAPTVDLIRTADGPERGLLNLEGFAATPSITREVFPQFGTINLEGFAGQFTSDPFRATSLLGELNLEGFAGTIELLRTPRPAFGTLNLEGFAGTVALLRTQRGALGELNLEGFAPSISIVREVRPQLGIVNFDGSISTPAFQRTATISLGELELEGFAGAITTITIVPEEEAAAPEGAGAGTYPDYDDELDVIMMVIREFLERVA